MRGISALHLEATRKHKKLALTSVNELKTAKFSGRIKDSKLEPWKVSSDSGSSVASSDAALGFWQFACPCWCNSSEDEPGKDVPACSCSSLTLESDDGDDESVGSTSSVAE